LRARNTALEAEVVDLRTGTEAAEDKARAELGMMRQGEIYVQILPPDGKPPELKAQARGGRQAVPAAPANSTAQPANPANNKTPPKPVQQR
jgi:cell division protein FtsB